MLLVAGPSRAAWRSASVLRCQHQSVPAGRRNNSSSDSSFRHKGRSMARVSVELDTSRMSLPMAAYIAQLMRAPSRTSRATDRSVSCSGQVRSYATVAPPSGTSCRKRSKSPPAPLEKSAWEERTISGSASASLATRYASKDDPSLSQSSSRTLKPDDGCCEEGVPVPNERGERAASDRKLRDEAAATDPRPFYKKYPPPSKAPEPIIFDQPAIPNPGKTAEAHQRFKKGILVAGGAAAVLLLLGVGFYAMGAFEHLHLEATSGLLENSQDVNVVALRTQRRIAEHAVACGNELVLDNGAVHGLSLSRQEREAQIRAEQKQAARGSYALLTLQRSSTIAKAVLLCLWDYRKTLNKKCATKQEEVEGLRQCHLRSAKRILLALQKNGGVYVKLGQHASSILLLPIEWTETLKPLQDQNKPTPLPELEAMFREETGMSFDEAFSEIDANPIGVASLAQVHRARDRKTGVPLAVKMMHPDVERFCEVDIRTVNNLTALVKRVFPQFEFSWLAEEMDANLPLEMDFRHEAENSRRAAEDFSRYRKTAVYLPKIPWAYKRVVAMEFIDGRRPDDLQYLAEHKIDRNRVSQELSRCFNQMLYMHGFFHADPHGGNVLIRPAPKGSRSPYNFEVVLLDHGLYFDIDRELRINYARFWLSLLSSSTPKVQAERRKYAKLVADIDDDLYPILESAVTGRSGLAGSDPNNPNGVKGRHRASSLLDIDGGAEMTEEEQEHIRKTVLEKEGLFTSVLELLRRVPRRMLMVLKLNDLTRSLDASLHTTHGPVRPFLIAARYCALSIWEDDKDRLRQEREKHGWSFSWFCKYLSCWYNYTYFYRGFGLLEAISDITSLTRKETLYTKPLLTGVSHNASKAASCVEAQEATKEKQDRDRV
ncbi:ABC1-domain-containing protein [Tilletiaria anomala UBC 951]|uniref:ABC1-domain-containing protein n=1 Tax=Tilletiaria anomala (strain ATCC 24038 / CBS 436.72 / UBC 951) TaxID=1037660 RepID=A0A066WQK0_TILAU|nr:ABC1-domain-containing protein [Tilletiaria anomala UBC 951]KDN52895.1 ABC1-domain-containing protein [Tilletiaria anomala UBC 951]